MNDLLLDTNTLSYILKRQPAVLDRLAGALREGRNFLLSPVAHYELARYLDLKAARRMLRDYEQLVRNWRRCELQFEDWSAAAALWAERHRLGKSLSDLDLLLVVLARKYGATLVTSNTRHFQDLGVSLEDWTADPSGAAAG